MTNREYNTIHQWNLKHWKKTGVCEHCRKKAKTQWSNRTNRYIKGYRSDWQELCHRCHREYDTIYLGTKFGKPKKAWIMKEKKALWYLRFTRNLMRYLQYDWS